MLLYVFKLTFVINLKSVHSRLWLWYQFRLRISWWCRTFICRTTFSVCIIAILLILQQFLRSAILSYIFRIRPHLQLFLFSPLLSTTFKADSCVSFHADSQKWSEESLDGERPRPWWMEMVTLYNASTPWAGCFDVMSNYCSWLSWKTWTVCSCSERLVWNSSNLQLWS